MPRFFSIRNLLIALHLGLVFAAPLRANEVSTSSSRSALSAAALEDREAAEFIQHYDKIRIGFTQAPGSGHQAYTITAMKRLRDLGFKGEFEIYYDPMVSSRLENMIPGFAGAKNSIKTFDGIGKVSAHEWTTAKGFPRGKWGNKAHNTWGNITNGQRGVIGENFAEKAQRLSLGIMGGDDWGVTPKQLNVDAMIRIHPSGWYKPPTVEFQLTPGEVARPNIHSLPQSLNRLPTRIEIPDPKDPIAFLREQASLRENLKRKLPGLEATVNAQAAGKIETLYLYGLGKTENGSVQRIANIMRALEIAQARSPELFHGPVVMPLIHSLAEDDWHLLIEEVAATPSLLHRMKVVEPTQASIASDLLHLKHGDIGVMPVGAVTQETWHYLFSHGTLPPTVAGSNGTNFMASVGKPYLKIPDPKKLEYDPSHEMASEMAKELEDTLNFENSSLNQNEIERRTEAVMKKVEKLATFFEESLRPDSKLNRDFYRHAEIIRSKADKVSSVLNRAVTELRNSEVKIPGVCTRTVLEAMEAK